MTESSPKERLQRSASVPPPEGWTLGATVEMRAMTTEAGRRTLTRLTTHEAALAEREGGLPGADYHYGSDAILSQSEQNELEIELYDFVWAIQDDLAAGRLIARGFERDTEKQPPARWWAEARLDRKTNRAQAHGLTLSGVRVYLAEAQGVVAPIPSPARGRGGAPPQYDWEGFTREVVRFACLDGFRTRTELMRHMRDWCAATWPEQPDERTLQRKVKEHCTSDFPDR